MEPDVIRMYSSSPPPLEDGAEEEEDDFGDFDGFSNVPNSVSFTEFDTPTSFNQVQPFTATSPPELLNDGRMAGVPSFSTTTSNPQEGDLSKANGVLPGSCHSSSPSERTVGEMKKPLSCSPDVPVSSLMDGQLPVDCNGEGPEVLTNGFVMPDVQGSPSLQNSVHICRKEASTEDMEVVLPESQDDEFADFTAFADVGDSPMAHTTEALHSPVGGSSPRHSPSPVHCNIEPGIHLEGNIKEAHRDGSDPLPFSELPDELSNQHQGSRSDTDSKQLDCVHHHSDTVCTTTETLALNGFCDDGSEENAGSGEDDPSGGRMRVEENTAASEEKAPGNQTEAQTLSDQPLTTTLEQCGDTACRVPSPVPQEDTATTPADHSQPPQDEDEEDDDEDFGDFDSVQGFADFDQLDVQPENDTASPESTADTQQVDDDAADDDFGDFNTPGFQPAGTEEEEEFPPRDGDNGNDTEDRVQAGDFPGSDSFGNFNSVAVEAEPREDGGWSAFSEDAGQADNDDSWAAFGEDQVSAPPAVQEEWSKPTPEAPRTTSSDQPSRTDTPSQQVAARSGRLERLFQQSFPENPVPELEEQVPPLKSLLEPVEQQKGSPRGPEDTHGASPHNGALRADVWRQLLDIHEAFGLRHQWGGSHSNKTLLCSLGIDTRNILFTGQKKQAIIVPMYASSLGMLEPTKEPVKPISAAEKIASIAQAPPLGPETSPGPSDPAQEALPPVQFDWSSSGLTNPLDGVDPELYELTTAKMDSTGSSSRVVDAFARLMSTMEKTSTSARKPKKEEHLSEEAAKVISYLPDLSFMQAKVLMFPATLKPLLRCSGATPD